MEQNNFADSSIPMEVEQSVGRKPELMIFVAAFSAFLATFNETFLNVAFTSIMADLGVGVATVQWLSTAYMLGAAVMVPISAFLYRSIPTKRLYLITVGFLVAGSVVCGLAPTFAILLLGRIIQALGTGMLIPIGMNITLEVAPKRKLGTYMGIMGAMTTLGPSSSVILAGLILAVANWHAMLWFFCALTVLCMICGACLLDDVAYLTHPKLDFLSVVEISLALIGILYGISTIFSGNYLMAVGIMLLGFLFLATFVGRQQKLEQPLIHLQPLKVKPFAIGVIINMFSLIVIFAMNIVTPMFLQSGLGISAFAASMTLFPAILLSCVISPLAGRIYDKHGAGILLPLGFLLIGAASLGLAAVHVTGNVIFLALLYIPVICGSALIIGPVQSLALSYLSFEQNPHGVTVMSTGFQIAGCIGASLFSGIYAICQPASYGFTAVCLLSAVFALGGIGLALYENRLSRTVVVEKPKLAGIGAIMKVEPYSISAQATALDALHCMVEKKTTGLPVVAADGTVRGFVSDGDIIRYMNGKESEASGFASMYPLWHNTGALDDRLSALAKFPVLELATEKVISIDVADDMQSLFQIFSDKRIKKIPVLQQGKLVGVVSRSDLLRQLVGKSQMNGQQA